MKTLKNIYESILDLPDVSDKDIVKNTKQQIKQFLRDNYKGVGKCRISNTPNSDGKFVVDCGGGLQVKNQEITSLTNEFFEFGEVKGSFSCQQCRKLTSLNGSPRVVGGEFNCSQCYKLLSLEGGPEIVKSTFSCFGCGSLESLKGAPKEMGGLYMTSCYSIASFEGLPDLINGYFNCSNCNLLKSLDHLPKVINGSFTAFYIGKKFTESDIRKHSQINGAVLC